ncbi:MAG TPA: hypothetical protein VEK84_02885 [Terriglobales bacterium]|nr:hypothetical protein [Terriglobales bacterium]
MKRLIIVLVVVLLPATLNASNIPLPGYENQTVIGVPCGGDLPTDLCTSVGDAIARTKAVLRRYSEQGWQLVSTTPMRYGPGNEGVVFLLGRNPAIKTPVKPPQRFKIVLGMSCGQDLHGLPYHLCTGNGASLEEILNGYSGRGWQVVNTTSCTYRYDQGDVGMVVYLLSK